MRAWLFMGRYNSVACLPENITFIPICQKAIRYHSMTGPFAKAAVWDFFLKGEKRSVRLERIHLEEDAGRLLHRADCSLIDFNRAGAPLLEIVTKPEIESPLSAAACARSIRKSLRCIDISDGNMEEGSLRCDCNISVRHKTDKGLGVKVELKNINSFRFMEKALTYEIKRQIQELKQGRAIRPETRLYDPRKNQTRPRRSKETAGDYRYFPEPDLPPMDFPPGFLSALSLPELPFDKTERFARDYGLNPGHGGIPDRGQIPSRLL